MLPATSWIPQDTCFQLVVSGLNCYPATPSPLRLCCLHSKAALLRGSCETLAQVLWEHQCEAVLETSVLLLGAACLSFAACSGPFASLMLTPWLDPSPAALPWPWVVPWPCLLLLASSPLLAQVLWGGAPCQPGHCPASLVPGPAISSH